MNDSISGSVTGEPGRIAICTAMGEEAAFFQALSTRASEPGIVGKASFQVLTIAGIEVLLVTSGIGLVNAAAAATIAITQFGATALISAGSAGGMGAEVQVGDVVIGTETQYTFADATAFGHYVKGQVPQMPASYQTNPQLVNLLKSDGLRTHLGAIISSDAFVTAHNFAAISKDFPAAQAADMETAAIAQVAYLFGVPWVAVRGISDLCGPAAAEDFATHLDGAAALSAQMVATLLAAGG